MLNLVLEVYSGYAGKHAARIPELGSRATYAHEFTVSGGLIVAIIVMGVVSSRTSGAFAEVVSPVAADRSIALP